jgi:hypothetical protein
MREKKLLRRMLNNLQAVKIKTENDTSKRRIMFAADDRISKSH